jgi:hypothetical protein
MFSYLRPHRRTPSNPTSPLPSPLPDQAHSWENPSHQPSDHTNYNASRAQDVNHLQSRPPNAFTPTSSLTPLNKAPSDGFDQLTGYRYEDTRQEEAPTWLAQGDTRVPSSILYDYPQKPQKLRPGSAGENGNIRTAGAQYPKSPPVSIMNQSYKGRAGGEFITAADLQQNPGKKQAGARIPTPPSTASQSTSTNDSAQHRPGKTRLNLLNPMSLLARRRNAQAATYPSPAPPPLSLSHPKLPDGYDPRIRGTRVHDFSAPRQKRNVSYNDVQAIQDATAAYAKYQRNQGAPVGDSGLKVPDERSPSRWSGGNHTPVFTEDFDEEQYPAAGPHVRKANDFTDLSMPKPPYARGATQLITQSEIASSRDVHTYLDQGTAAPKPRTSSLVAQPPIPANFDSEYTSEMFDSPLENFDKREPSQEPPRASSSRRTRARNTSQASAKDYLPKHMQSTSSRFSFDMIGAAGQEKLLEDRHRQKALEKKSSSPEPRDPYDNEMEDDYDYDNMFDDDGLEERIPGVNADAEDDEDDGFVNDNENLAGFSFHSLGASVSNSPLSPYSPGMVSTPRDANGDIIGFAVTKGSPLLQMHQTPPLAGLPKSPADVKSTVGSEQNEDGTSYPGLGLQGLEEIQDTDNSQTLNDPVHAAPGLAPSSKPSLNDDDLYFDDGIIDPPNDDEAAEFDESVFDNDDTNEYGRPLRSLSSMPTLYSPPLVQPNNVPSAQEPNGISGGIHMSQASQDLESPISPKSQHALAPHPSVSERIQSIDQSLLPGASLTHDTLSAYQSALAAAAYAAAANGRFRRDSSPTVYFDERDEEPGMVTDDSHFNSDLSTRQPLSPGYEDGFDYDDALEDDSIIAEANAEALANDSDGFYGQEFGFYSSATGEAQYGGYFGPRGPNAVPNQPGRIVSREPNLTPITERSEYSNRNSIMSLPLSAVSYGMGPGSLSSPGLAQLAGMMGDYKDNDMSLDALLKLRRGAWGGSQASLRSSNGSPMSAVGEDSPAANSSLAQNNSFSYARHLSGLSIGSDFNASPAESAPESPTLTMSMSMPSRQAPALSVQPPISSSASGPGLPAPPPALVSSLNSRPLSPTMKFSSAAVGLVVPNQSENDKDGRPGSGSGSSVGTGLGIGSGGGTSLGINSGRKGAHRHTASSDSISYVKEGDPVVGERWVLERRRTAESGEVEILGREIISGGMI